MIDDGTCYRCPLMKWHEGPCATVGICTRERYHDGPCNGFPRSVDSSKGVYCYTPRPIVRTLGQQVDDAISRHQADAERLAADNRRLKERVKRLEDALGHLRGIEHDYGIVCYIDGALSTACS